MKTVLVVAPHPDDETLGCGGTLLKHISQGDNVHWLIITGMTEEHGYSAGKISQRKRELDEVTRLYAFSSMQILNLPPARLDTIPLAELIDKIGGCFKQINPEIVYLPHGGDAHSDHRIVFNAAGACTKWFRYGSIKRVLAYETLSETDFALYPGANGFHPNVYNDITDFLEKKITIMKTYATELGSFPFPRSVELIRAQSAHRGAVAGVIAAEAFMLLKETL